MNIDIRELARDPFWLLASVVGLVGIKAGVMVLLARLYRQPWPVAIETGLLLGPGGEFAFVVLGMATGLGLVADSVSSFAIAVTSITMALIPAFSVLGRQLSRRFAEAAPLDPDLLLKPEAGSGHAIVIGHGRVGQVVCAQLDRHNLPYVAVDRDATAIRAPRRNGRPLYYGNAADPDFLRNCGVMEARAVILTIGDKPEIDEIVRWVRSLRSDVVIVSRAKDAEHARHLYSIGVTDAVPETIEASLQLSEAALLGLGQAAGLVIASIHEQRDEFRRALQAAAERGA
jgi:monovalent cation:H+ antiporter-2, CPA2 family